MVHPDDWERVDAAIRDAIAEKMEDFRLQCRTMTPAGEYAWSLTQGRIRYGEGGRPERISGMTIDISDLKGAEERLSRRVMELESAAQEAFTLRPTYSWWIPRISPRDGRQARWPPEKSFISCEMSRSWNGRFSALLQRSKRANEPESFGLATTSF